MQQYNYFKNSNTEQWLSNHLYVFVYKVLYI